MKTQQITKYGVTLTISRNKKGILKTEVHSILDAFDETPGAFYNWCESEGLKTRPAYLTTDQTSAFLFYLAEHNQIARDYQRALIMSVVEENPELANEAVQFVQQHLEETGDRLVDETWIHPLAESFYHNGEPYTNPYGVATALLKTLAFEPNETARKHFNQILLSHNPLTNLTAIHRSIECRLESEWMIAATKFVDAWDSFTKKAAA